MQNRYSGNMEIEIKPMSSFTQQLSSPSVFVIIPALNEERTLPLVIKAVPSWVERIIVVDNASSDNTARVAYKTGAEVVFEQKRGYGSACNKGVMHAKESTPPPDIIVFLDGDFADDPTVMADLILPIVTGEADLVIGSRVKGTSEKEHLTFRSALVTVCLVL